jgi:hypothetical protein
MVRLNPVRATEEEMHELSKLVDWLRRLDAIATAVVAWKGNAHAPFTNSAVLALLEQQIGWNVVELV